MKPSLYIKTYPLDGDPETLILYSTKTSALILIPKDLYKDIKKGNIPEEEKALLKELNILVEDKERERNETINIFDRIKDLPLIIILVLNLDCNFACKYCFENEIKSPLYMTPKILDGVMDFIKKELEKEPSDLILGLYGGEPLLSLDLVKEALIKAKKICHEIGVELKASMITNGSLFDKETAKELSKLGLDKVRITLDGPPEIHNKFRPFKDGRESFEIILKNIKNTIDIINRFEISGNYARENYHKFPHLLDILMQEGITPDKVESIRFEPIIKQPTGLSIYKGGCSSINEPWVAEASLFLREEILKRSYKTKKIEPIFCLVNNKRAFIINVDGGLYKCPGFLGIREFQIGDIFNGPKEPEAYNPNRWKNEKCTSCIYLPLCYGGCRYMSYLKYGNLNKLDCQKPFFDKNLEAFIKQDIRYRKEIG